jgi:hypothetical protein
MPMLPVDLSKYKLQDSEGFTDWCDSLYLDQDPEDGRGDLRRQAFLYHIDINADEDEQVILNPATSVDVASAYLGISQRQYYRLVEAGILPSFPRGEIDLEIAREAFLAHKGIERTCWNPRTGKNYAYRARKKVW